MGDVPSSRSGSVLCYLKHVLSDRGIFYVDSWWCCLVCWASPNGLRDGSQQNTAIVYVYNCSNGLTAKTMVRHKNSGNTDVSLTAQAGGCRTQQCCCCPVVFVWPDSSSRLTTRCYTDRCLSLFLPPSRDLKPSNIGLCGAGHIKVFDLGLSVVRQVLEAPTRVYEVRREGGGARGEERGAGNTAVRSIGRTACSAHLHAFRYLLSIDAV